MTGQSHAGLPPCEAAPGDETVWFRDAGPRRRAGGYAWDAVTAALGNHPHFIRAALEQPSFGPLNIDTSTALTRTGNAYILTLTARHRPVDDQEHTAPGRPAPGRRLMPTGPVAARIVIRGSRVLLQVNVAV
ncbi:hypothetical protein [Streptomyces sp. NPDC059398]|uniref:hypothetical protein n=1 Tax=Streptomyces sp. NPDC059398 TaxID=3346820 RepID=UPI00368602E9